MANTLENNKIKYLDLTHKLNDYNEIYSVNNYLLNASSSDLERLQKTNDNIKTRILRMKQEYMLNDRGVSEYKFRLSILYFTSFVIAIVLIVASLYSQGGIDARMTMIIGLGLIFVYFIIVLIIIKSNTERRNYAYSQYYWKQIQKKN